jgi:hypothetical protein
MARRIIICFLTLSGLNAMAQFFCHSTEMQNAWFDKNPAYKLQYEQSRQKLNAHLSANKSAAASPTHTIPVVFHILHQGGNENISDAQVIDAVNILTRDYNRLNPDTTSVVTSFKNLIGDVQVEFRLATKDPNGNCTNGIIRHWDPNTNLWSGNFSDYVYSWPSNQYLNIYVVRSMDFNAAGYTYLPGSGVPADVDAIVVLSTCVGSIGSSNVFTSRVLTHEVGHWLNLEHTWGWSNSPGVSCGDDGIWDTPVTMGFTTCLLSHADICNPGTDENVQNYMDYSYCSNMFTIDQAQWMQQTLASTSFNRDYLSTPSNLAATGITNPGTGCVPLMDISAKPQLTICSGASLSLVSYTSNAAPTGYTWTANNGAIVVSPNSSSTAVIFANMGVINVQCVAANANGSISKYLLINVEDGFTKISTSAFESFQDAAQILPPSWTIINTTTPLQKWTIHSSVGSHSNQSMYVPGEAMQPGSVEILESPSYDLKHNPGMQFTFKYAYAKKSTTHKDIFKVQATKNCGATWVDVWTPSSTYLAQGSGNILSSVFIPTPGQWKICELSAAPNFQMFRIEENVKFRFYFQEDNNVGYGNRFYLDEVNFNALMGLNDLEKQIELNVYPNPAQSSFHLNFNLSEPSKIKYQVISVTGSELINTDETLYNVGNHDILINENRNLAPGIYFVNLELNGIKMSRKIVVN